MKAFIIPGIPGWFYSPRPIDTKPGAVNRVNHVLPGQRPLRELAACERELNRT